MKLFLVLIVSIYKKGEKQMKILKNEKFLKAFFIVILMLILILGFARINNASDLTIENSDSKLTKTKKNNVYVVYNSHIQDYGWENEFSKVNGQTSGTTGQNKKIEAIKIKLTDAPAGVGITYQSYVNGYEWQEYVSNGEKSRNNGAK